VHTAILIREARIADSEQLAGVHTRSWQVAYRGQLPDALLDGLDPRDRTATWRQRLASDGEAVTLTAVDDRSQRIIGFITVGPQRRVTEGATPVLDDGRDGRDGRDRRADATGQQGPLERRWQAEVYAIYVDPPWWGHGIGTALLDAGVDRLRTEGFEHATLWVLGSNERTHRFYGHHGWIRDGHRQTVRIAATHAATSDPDHVEVEEIRYARRLDPP